MDIRYSRFFPLFVSNQSRRGVRDKNMVVAAAVAFVQHEMSSIFAEHVKRETVTCTFGGLIPLIVSYIRWFPYAVVIVVWSWGYFSGQFLFAAFGWMMTLVWLSMWPWKSYFNVLRADPYCPDLKTWAFPNDEMLYVSISLFTIIGYTLLWKSNRTWAQWLGMIAILLVPIFVLALFDDIWWGYLVISFAMGIVFAGIFTWWVWQYSEGIAVVLSIWPMTVLYRDTFIVSAGNRGIVIYNHYRETMTAYWERRTRPKEARPTSFSMFV